MEVEELGAVVLGGGGAVRLGGADKASIEVGGRTLLEHALAAVGRTAEVVVVGSEVPTSRPVTFTREDPAGGGPAAGLQAGLQRFSRVPPAVVVLAVDMPLVSTRTVDRLVAALGDDVDGTVLVDDTGRLQPLCAAYRSEPLRQAFEGAAVEGGHGLAMRQLLAGLRLAEVPSVGGETRDLDTWQDLADLRAALGG